MTRVGRAHLVRLISLAIIVGALTRELSLRVGARGGGKLVGLVGANESYGAEESSPGESLEDDDEDEEELNSSASSPSEDSDGAETDGDETYDDAEGK